MCELMLKKFALTTASLDGFLSQQAAHEFIPWNIYLDMSLAVALFEHFSFQLRPLQIKVFQCHQYLIRNIV